jgi:hypothetical protein
MLTRHMVDLRSFSTELKNLHKDRLDVEMHDTREPWTMQMAFHALSGTCVYRSKYTTGKTMIALDLDTMMFLAFKEPETLMPVRMAALQNPGQSSGIVKIVTCIQAAWFCSQCIARVSSGMAISLLELNTFAHCVSAFFLYGFWWHKPYDVTSHTFVQSEMLDFLFLHRAAIEANRRWNANRHVAGVGLYAYGGGPGIQFSEIDLEEVDSEQEEDAYFVKVTEGDMVPGTGIFLRKPDLPRAGSRAFFVPRQSLMHWQRLWGFMVETPNAIANLDKDLVGLLSKGQSKSTRGCGWRLYPKVPKGPLRYPAPSLGLVTSVNIACILYGGLHLLAWHYHFRSTAEVVLWRLSGVLTAATGVVDLVLSLFLLESSITTGKNWIYLFSVWNPINIAARTFLFTESFVALPNSPLSAYLVPNWTAYIPHI